MTSDYAPGQGRDAGHLSESRSRLLRAGASGDRDKATGVLTGWQAAGFRGYTVVERRLDRRLVVHLMATHLSSGEETPNALLIAADDASAVQWTEYLSRDRRQLPHGWEVRTPAAILADGGQLPDDCIVVADEPEAYLDDDVAAAFMGTRGVLGLCAAPSGLTAFRRYRKFVGQSLNVTRANSLDLLDLLDPPSETTEFSPEDADTRERLLTVGDPTDFLGFYLTQTQKYPLLTAEEEIVLAKQIEAGIIAEAIR